MKQSSLDAMKWKKCYCVIYSVCLIYYLALVKFLLTQEQTMEQIVAFVVFWDATIYCIKIKNTSLIRLRN